MYFWLDNNLRFPDLSYADEEGLLALGGDLSVGRLLLAYKNGIFPWYTDDQPILWWSPPERYIIRPGNAHISHSMKKFFKKHKVQMEIGRDFSDTMHRCRIKRENETWITDDMEEAYHELSESGYAVGVEAYFDDVLAGGLYGVVVDKCFFGESMFTDISNGSKAALIMLSDLLYQKGFSVIDCQFHTDHLESMGGEMISRDDYVEILRKSAVSNEKQSISGKYYLNENMEVVLDNDAMR